MRTIASLTLALTLGLLSGCAGAPARDSDPDVLHYSVERKAPASAGEPGQEFVSLEFTRAKGGDVVMAPTCLTLDGKWALVSVYDRKPRVVPIETKGDAEPVMREEDAIDSGLFTSVRSTAEKDGRVRVDLRAWVVRDGRIRRTGEVHTVLASGARAEAPLAPAFE